MGYLLLGVYFNLSIWFKVTDKTKFSFWITLIGAIVSIILIFTLVPILGYLGGALSTLGCYLVMTSICFWYGQKFYPIPYQTKKGLFYLIFAFGLSYAGFYIETGFTWIDFILKNTAVLIFLAAVLVLEKKQLYSMFPKKSIN